VVRARQDNTNTMNEKMTLLLLYSFIGSLLCYFGRLDGVFDFLSMMEEGGGLIWSGDPDMRACFFSRSVYLPRSTAMESFVLFLGVWKLGAMEGLRELCFYKGILA
jgi:hypothetical protein